MKAMNRGDNYSRTERSIGCGASLLSHLLEEMAHIIQTADECQLQCLMIEFAVPAGR
jgi:hypothetical protein